MRSMSGFELWNSDTPMGRALRSCFPGNVMSLDIHLELSEVLVHVLYVMLDELRNVDWTQFLFDSEKRESVNTQLDVLSARTGKALTLSLIKQQAEELARFVSEDRKSDVSG